MGRISMLAALAANRLARLIDTFSHHDFKLFLLRCVLFTWEACMTRQLISSSGTTRRTTPTQSLLHFYFHNYFSSALFCLFGGEILSKKGSVRRFGEKYN